MHSLPATQQTPVNTSSSHLCPHPDLVSLTHADDRAALLALLATFLRFAFVVVDDGDPGVFVGHVGGDGR